MLGGIFFIDVGDFKCLPGEREKCVQGGRLPLNAGELEALFNMRISNTLLYKLCYVIMLEKNHFFKKTISNHLLLLIHEKTVEL